MGILTIGTAVSDLAVEISYLLSVLRPFAAQDLFISLNMAMNTRLPHLLRIGNESEDFRIFVFINRYKISNKTYTKRITIKSSHWPFVGVGVSYFCQRLN